MMKITQAHLDFWESKQRQPSWANKIRKPTLHKAFSTDLIDQLINIQAGHLSHRDLDKANLIALVHRHVGKGDPQALIVRLMYLAENSDPRFKRRAATARKWWKRIARDQREIRVRSVA